MRIPNARGFALIELMVIVAVISLAASFFVPRFLKHRIQIRQQECTRNLRSLYEAEKAYRTSKKAFTEDLKTLGWAPEGKNRYQYKFLESSKTAFRFECSGNIDKDPTLDIATIDQDGIISQSQDDLKR